MTVKQLHAEFGGYLLSRLRYYGVPSEDCEDVRQDIYLALLRKYGQGEFAANKSFCSKVAHNAAVTRFRETQTSVLTAPIDNPTIAAELNTSAFEDWCRMNGDGRLDLAPQLLQIAMTFMFRPDLSAFSLIQDRLDGLTERQMAEKYNIDQQTVSKWLNAWWAHAKSLSE